MPSSPKLKKKARALQKRTGWFYTECLRCIRDLTPEAVEALIVERAKKVPGG